MYDSLPESRSKVNFIQSQNNSEISTSVLFCDWLKLGIVAEGFLAECRTHLSTDGRSSRLNPYSHMAGIPFTPMILDEKWE